MEFPYQRSSKSGENPPSILHQGGVDRFHFACQFCIFQYWLLELLEWEDMETSHHGHRGGGGISDQLVMSALAEGEAEMV